MKLTLEIEKVANGYVITAKDKKYVARSVLEMSRKITSIIEGNEPMEVKR